MLTLRRFARLRGLDGAAVATQQRYLDPGRPTGERPSARRNSQMSAHPLAERSPSSRSIHVPDKVHAAPGSKLTRTAEQQAHAVRKQVLRRYEEEMLWGQDPLVSSKENWLVNYFKTLRADARYRYSKRMMIVAGRDLLRELGDMGHFPEHMIVPQHGDVPDWARRGGAQIVRATESAKDEMAPNTDGYIGNFRIPEPSMNEELMANQLQLKRVAVFDNIEDPGTLGSMMRTAASLAYDCVLLTNHCADMYDHRTVSAARGAHFQNLTKFYSLRDVDGDDVYGIINHVMERNHLDPVLFSSAGSSGGSSTRLPTADGGNKTTPPPKWLTEQMKTIKAARQQAAASTAAVDIQHAATKLQNWADSSALPRQSLHTYCVDFHLNEKLAPAPSSAESRDILKPGIMLITGPDHTTPLPERVAGRLKRRPTVLELDAPTSNFAMSLPIVMHQLRPTAAWDYMLPRDAEGVAAATSAASSEQLLSRHVDIGPDRPRGIAQPNETEDEFKARIRAKRQQQRLDRLDRNLNTDATRWEELQMKRILAKERAAQHNKLNPLKPIKPSTVRHDDMAYPDYIAESMEEGFDRESLREVEKWAQTYTPPPNYDDRFRPPTPTVRRHRVVPTSL
jgi:hypothetical protein